MKIQDNLRLALENGRACLGVAFYIIVAERVGVYVFKGASSCIFMGIYYAKVGAKLLKNCVYRCISIAKHCGKVGLELLKKGAPYFIYLSIHGASLIPGFYVINKVSIERLDILEIEPNKRNQMILVGIAILSSLATAMLLTPPMTKRLTKYPMNHAQCARHGLEIAAIWAFYMLKNIKLRMN